jgi:hypothetical protein
MYVPFMFTLASHKYDLFLLSSLANAQSMVVTGIFN